jgi:hypothetical protein
MCSLVLKGARADAEPCFPQPVRSRRDAVTGKLGKKARGGEEAVKRR